MNGREHAEHQYPWSPCTPISAHSGSLVSRSSSPWFDDTSSVGRERDINIVCSDFTCCGLSLIDLHSLVDHFEEAHVVVFDSTGNAVYPHPSPMLRIIDHEEESFVLGYHPAPRVPVAFLDTKLGSESASGLPSPSTASEPTSSVETSPEEEPRHLPPIVLVEAASKPMLSVCNNKREPRSRQRRKDKTYKCPYPDCTKTYLNANGLRYHLEKGTCKTEISVPK